eukprot:gene11801-16078_t
MLPQQSVGSSPLLTATDTLILGSVKFILVRNWLDCLSNHAQPASLAPDAPAVQKELEGEGVPR